jgi:hypothetical protein
MLFIVGLLMWLSTSPDDCETGKQAEAGLMAMGGEMALFRINLLVLLPLVLVLCR